MNKVDKAKVIHRMNVDAGWWPEDTYQVIYSKYNMLTSELMEFYEAVRKGQGADKHLPEYQAPDVELADILIRAYDLAGYWLETGEDPDDLSTDSYLTPSPRVGVHVFTMRLTSLIVSANYTDYPLEGLSRLIHYCESWCHQTNIPVDEIIDAKVRYNKSRADHKPENRAAPGGKKF